MNHRRGVYYGAGPRQQQHGSVIPRRALLKQRPLSRAPLLPRAAFESMRNGDSESRMIFGDGRECCIEQALILRGKMPAALGRRGGRASFQQLLHAGPVVDKGCSPKRSSACC